MNWTEFLEEEIETAQSATIKLLDKVDEAELDWKPQTGSNWMTLGQLLCHITDACGAGCRAFVTGDWGLPDGKNFQDLTPQEIFPPAEKLPTLHTIAEVRNLFFADIALARQMIEKAGEQVLSNQMVAAPWEPSTPHPLGWHIHQMVLHLIQHKAQLFYYLKLQGVPLSTPDLWG